MTAAIAYTIEDASKLAGIGRTRLYELIGNKTLDARKSGSRTLIVAASLHHYIANLPSADIGAGHRRGTAYVAA